MVSQFGQVFYGRDSNGYGVLGVSPAGRSFIGAVAALCRTVGSPDRPGDVRPFLISKREGDAVLMIRACRGAADPTGRATIFFHALIADEAALRDAGLDAFALAGAGVFAESCRSRELSDLPFPKGRQKDITRAGNRPVDMPATVYAERPLDEFVQQSLGENSLDRNWATFTFNPLSGFDLCVLSSYSPRKGAGTQYSFDDSGLHRISLESAMQKTTKNESTSAEGVFVKNSSLILLVSLVANAILVLALLMRVGNTVDGKPEGPSSEAAMTESSAREKWEANWKSEWEKSLPKTSSVMTEAEAKAKWAAQWKLEWEKSLPPMPSAMTEAEAKAKWEATWRKEWTQTLRMDFEKAIRDSGGEWPIHFDNANSPFLSIVRSADTEPEDEKLAQKWRIYRSCKTCFDFIQTHFNP